MYTDSSLVVSAPTGSGKTVIFELAIIRLLMQSSIDMITGKIIYGGYNISHVLPNTHILFISYMQWLLSKHCVVRDLRTGTLDLVPWDSTVVS